MFITPKSKPPSISAGDDLQKKELTVYTCTTHSQGTERPLWSKGCRQGDMRCSLSVQCQLQCQPLVLHGATKWKSIIRIKKRTADAVQGGYPKHCQVHNILITCRAGDFRLEKKKKNRNWAPGWALFSASGSPLRCQDVEQEPVSALKEPNLTQMEALAPT